MKRNNIHQQISAIIDKISYLNKKLKEEQDFHTVEIDLLKSYSDELRELIKMLESTTSSAMNKAIETKLNEPTVTVKEMKDIELVEQEEMKEPIIVETKAPKKILQEQSTEENLEDEKNQQPSIEVVNNEKNIEKAPDELPSQEGEADDKPPETLISTKQAIISSESFKTENREEENKISLNEKFKISSIDLSEKLKHSERKNLKEKMDLNERYVFIQELFEGDAEYFNKSLRELDQCKSMEEAQEYIKTSIEEKFAWEEKQKYASKFIELVLNNFEINNN